jgi:membrane-associated protease RseP (regulator of RpoE activity)
VFALKVRMRFALTAASVLFAGFVSTAAFADEAPAPPPTPAPAPSPVPAAAKKMPLRVVRVLTETHQALLFDKTKGTHVLVETGKEIDGFKVDDIDEDTVTLTPIEGGAQVVLAGPDPSWRRHGDSDPGHATKPAATAAPEDPYASAAPMDPYGADDVRVAEAPGSVASGPVASPIAAGDGGVRTASALPSTVVPRTVSAATGATVDPTTAPATTAPTAPAAPIIDTSSASNWSTLPAPDATPAITPAVAPPAAAAPNTDLPTLIPLPTMISKTDVAAALSNFGALAGSMRGSFTPAGAKIDAVGPDSLLAKAGLRPGDVITSINNQPLRSLDDAANLYARAGSMKVATIVFQRAGKPMMLRLAIQ